MNLEDIRELLNNKQLSEYNGFDYTLQELYKDIEKIENQLKFYGYKIELIRV